MIVILPIIVSQDFMFSCLQRLLYEVKEIIRLHYLCYELYFKNIYAFKFLNKPFTNYYFYLLCTRIEIKYHFSPQECHKCKEFIILGFLNSNSQISGEKLKYYEVAEETSWSVQPEDVLKLVQNT